MDITTLVQTAIVSALTANHGIQVFVGTRIYELQAPAQTPYPFIIMTLMAGGDTNISPRREIDLEYLIEAWAENSAVAATIAGYVDGALHEQTLTIDGWTNYRTHANAQRSQIENDEGKQIWRRGAIYQITIADAN